MAQKNIAIYITSDEIKICDIEKRATHLTVLHAFSVRTPRGAVEDGLILDVQLVAQVISEELMKRKITKAKLYLTIYSRKIAAKEIDLPYIKKTNIIGNMIRANIEDYFPMGNLEEYLTRFTILDIVEVEGRKNYRLVVYAAHQDLIASYLELAKALKMPLGSIDYTVNSLYHLVQKQNKHGETSLILQMDDEATHLSIMRGTSQLFRRSIPHGGDTLAQSLAASKDITEEKAVEILRDEAKLDEYMDADEYTDMVSDFSAAITRVVDFFTSRNHDVIIEKVKLFGTGAKIVRLDKMLETALGHSVEIIEHFHGVSVKTSKKGSNEELTHASVAGYLPNIGSLIQPLDLRLEEEVRMKKTGIGIPFFLFLLALSVLITVGFVIFVYWHQNILNNEKKRLENNIEALRPVELVVDAYYQTQDYHALIDKFDRSTLNDNEMLLDFFVALEERMPDLIGITQIQSQNGSISMNVTCANGKEGVARFIMELNKIPFVTDVFIGSIRDIYEDDEFVASSFPVTLTIFNLEKELEVLGGDNDED